MADSTVVWASTRPDDAGVLYAAPLGSTAPTNATTALDAAFEDHGWLTDDGIVNEPKRTTSKKYAFGGDVIKVVQERYEETLVFTCAETNPIVLETVFGADNVDVDNTGGHRVVTVEHSSLPLERKMFCAEVIEGSKTRRILVREGQVTEVGAVNHKSTDIAVYKITVDCFKPAGEDAAVVEFIDEPDVLADSGSGS